jgi:HSP20 family protein
MPFKDHDLNQALKNLREMEKEVEELMKDFLISKNQTLMVSEDGWTPHVDVYETTESLVVKIELSGVNKDDVKVQMRERELLISGKRVDNCEEDREDFHIAEIAYGKFSREELVSAQYDQGYLKIMVPKARKDKDGSVVIPISD